MGLCLGVILLTIIAAAVLWGAGESHYRSCLTEAELRYPAAYQQGGTEEPNPYLEEKTPGHFVFHEKAQREDAISSCSRWP